MVLLCTHALANDAQELFPNQKSKAYQYSEVLDSNASVGGRAIYQGGRQWHIADLSNTSNNMNIQIGRAVLVSPHDDDLFLMMTLTTSLSAGSESGYFTADLCSPANSALVKISKAVGKFDNCLTIQYSTMQIYSQPMPGLQMTVRNSKSNWRLYDMRLFVNLALVGYPNASAEEWSSAAVQADAGKQQFVERITQWARTVQDGVDKAMDYSKPATAFDGVESIDSVFKPKSSGAKPAVARYSSAPNSSIEYVYCDALGRMVNPAQEQCR